MKFYELLFYLASKFYAFPNEQRREQLKADAEDWYNRKLASDEEKDQWISKHANAWYVQLFFVFMAVFLEKQVHSYRNSFDEPDSDIDEEEYYYLKDRYLQDMQQREQPRRSIFSL